MPFFLFDRYFEMSTNNNLSKLKCLAFIVSLAKSIMPLGASLCYRENRVEKCTLYPGSFIGTYYLQRLTKTILLSVIHFS